MTSRSPFEYVVPVYDPESGELLECLFREAEIGLCDEAMVEWIETHGIVE